MQDKEATKDYLQNESVKDCLQYRLQEEIRHARSFFSSFTMSTIRWLQRYSHCYSIICSFMCFPLWILMLPIAFALDICIYFIISIIFIIAFVLYILFGPCMLAYEFSSCSDAWHPLNIYRYSLTKALAWSVTIFAMFNVTWLLYCGSGEIEYGTPTCCTFSCCETCHQACSEATHIEISDRGGCTIL